MTNMNPLRDNEVAAQERIIQLEKELKEKNQLIHKLQNPVPKKPKQPRQPIDWSRLSAKSIKIIGVCACLGWLFYTCEPNQLYTSDGIITYVGKAQTKTICHGPVKIMFKNGEAKTQDTQCDTYVGYNIKASFLDIGGKTREISAEAFEKTGWFNSDTLPLEKKFYNNRILYPKNVNHLKKGCKIKAYFLRSYFLKTHPWWQNPRIDASVCGE